jgi:replicative DNA helicase
MFSLEMTHVELVQRLIASESLVNISLSRKQELSKIQSAALGQAVDVLSDLPIKIDDTPMLTINEIQSKIKQVSATNTIKLVVVDYLQLIKGPKSNSQNNREREVAEVSRTLKAIAKSYNTPVIALAQLSRKIEERQPMGNRHQPPYSSEPKLSDLRESGSIEQDADIVSFL